MIIANFVRNRRFHAFVLISSLLVWFFFVSKYRKLRIVSPYISWFSVKNSLISMCFVLAFKVVTFDLLLLPQNVKSYLLICCEDKRLIEQRIGISPVAA